MREAPHGLEKEKERRGPSLLVCIPLTQSPPPRLLYTTEVCNAEKEGRRTKGKGGGPVTSDEALLRRKRTVYSPSSMSRYYAKFPFIST